MPLPDKKPSVAGAVALIVIGLLIFVPSGLCTGVFLFAPLIDALMHPATTSTALALGPTALVVGGPFVLAGGALLLLGLRRLRASRAKVEKPDLTNF